MFFNHPLALYNQPAYEMALKWQQDYWDFLTGGLISDIQEEIENAGVETQALLKNLGGHNGMITEKTLENAIGKFGAIHSQLINNLFWLPIDRHIGRDAKKRFPVVLEGEFTQAN